MKDLRDSIIMKTPSSWADDKSKEALPAGNGITGILVCGGVKTENITINRRDLWHNMRRSELPDISYTLLQARDALDRGDFSFANRVACEELQKKGFSASVGNPFSLCNLKLDFPCSHAFTHYRRILNMSTGEITVSYNINDVKYQCKAFVSRACDAIIIDFTATDNVINGSVQIQLHELARSLHNKELFYDNLKNNLIVFSDENYIFYKSTNDDGKAFGAVLKFFCDGEYKACDNGEITVTSAKNIKILIKTFANSDYKSSFKTLKADLDAIEPDYCNLLQNHAAIHSELYDSSNIELYDENNDLSNEELLLDAYEEKASLTLIEKLWRYGRYLFISGSDSSSLPFPLYGLWHYGYCMPWAQNVANENVEMIYWHQCTGGLAKLVKPLIDYYFTLIDDFRENAKKLFNCRGIYVTAYTSPGIGLSTVNVPVILNWISGAGWLSRHFYDYYRFTGDTQTLKEKVLPFMYEAALFYKDYAVIDDNGKIKLYPSVSPENSPNNFIPECFNEHMGHMMPTAINATMDFAILKELLLNLIMLSQKCDMYTDDIPTWQDMLAKIPDYMINPDGDVKEWMHPELHDHYNHRHLSHIYPVFPGNEVNCENNPALMPAFEKAVDKRELGGQSGWSLAHMANIYARFGHGDRALGCLDIVTRACLTNSFMTLHNDYRDMGLSLELNEFTARQLDANMGVVNAVQEMLLYVSPTLVKILPACPERFIKGRIENFCFETGTISFKWNMEEKSISGELCLTNTTQIKIKIPDFCEHVTVESSSEGVFIDGNFIIIDIPKGVKFSFFADNFKATAASNFKI